MSEPTYRVTLTNDPAEQDGFQWQARIYRVADDEQVFDTQWAGTHEAAFELAQERIRRASLPTQSPMTVLLSEDGDILDPHEVQR